VPLSALAYVLAEDRAPPVLARTLEPCPRTVQRAGYNPQPVEAACALRIAIHKRWNFTD